MTNSTEPLRGEKLLKTAINQILLHPETWDQTDWHSACGTKHCLAGWCQILSGKSADNKTAMQDAQEALGISEGEARQLFCATCGIGEIYQFAQRLAAGYNRAGYDLAGYDRFGYDRFGYDRFGYDRAGYNRDGKPLTPFSLD